MSIFLFGTNTLVMRLLSKLLKDRASTLLWFMGAILVGRVTGLIREIVLGNLFGATRTADLIITALTIPDALVNVFLVSGFSAVLVPYLLAQPLQSRSREFWRIALTLVVISLFISVCLLWITESVMSIFAPGLIPFQNTEVSIFRFVLGSLPLTIASGLLVAWLMSRNSFVFGGLGTAIINIAVISGLLVGYIAGDALVWTVIGLVLGLLVRLLVNLFASARNQLEFGFHGLSCDVQLGKTLVLAAMAMSALTLAPLLFRAIVSIEGEGALTLFSMSLKLIELPLTVVFWSIGFVALPELSALYGQSAQLATDRLEDNLIKAGKIGIAVFLCVAGLADRWVELIYGWGAFTLPQLELMSNAVSIGAVGFPLMGLTTVLLNDHFALKRYRAVFLIVIASLLMVGVSAWSGIFDRSIQVMFMCWVTLYGFIGLSLWISRAIAGLPMIKLQPSLLYWSVIYLVSVYFVLEALADSLLGTIAADVLYITCASVVAWIAIVKTESRV